MHIKKDDNIIMISGKDKGKSGKVIKSLPKRDMVIVAGINVKKRHRRPSKDNQKGQIVDVTLPVHISNVKKA